MCDWYVSYTSKTHRGFLVSVYATGIHFYFSKRNLPLLIHPMCFYFSYPYTMGWMSIFMFYLRQAWTVCWGEASQDPVFNSTKSFGRDSSWSHIYLTQAWSESGLLLASRKMELRKLTIMPLWRWLSRISWAGGFSYICDKCNLVN